MSYGPKLDYEGFIRGCLSGLGPTFKELGARRQVPAGPLPRPPPPPTASCETPAGPDPMKCMKLGMVVGLEGLVLSEMGSQLC